MRNFPKIILIAAILTVFCTLGYFWLKMRPAKPEIALDLKDQENGIKVKIIDAFANGVIAGKEVEVEVWSDKSKECIKQQCNIIDQRLKGISDNEGYIALPNQITEYRMSISAEGYRAKRDLSNDSVKHDRYGKEEWLIELDPDSQIDNGGRKIKLIDANTDNDIINTPVWITNLPDCRPPDCSDFSFSGITNALGNVYYPESSLENPENSWIYVSGYQTAKLPQWGIYKVRLERAID